MPKEKNIISFYYLELNSTLDLARLAYNFDYTCKNIFFDKISNKIFVIGEKVQELNIIYYLKIKNAKNFLRYTPPTSDKNEAADFVEEKVPDDTSSFYMNVINMSIDNLTEKSNKKINLKNIEIENFSDIIRLSLHKSEDDNKLSKIYSFNDSKNTYLFGFDLVNLHNDDKILFFSKFELDKNNSNFFAYDYKENSVMPISILGGHQYLYTKLIKLKERPSFFNNKSF